MKSMLRSSILLLLFVIGLTVTSFAQKQTKSTQEVGSPQREVFAAPTVTGVSPSSGSGGTFITITGTNFTGATAVTINGAAVSSFTTLSATQITATVSDNATTGKITVTASGTGTSASDFTVFPRIDNFTPASGPKGTSVVITGGNFSNVTSVKFNGTTATFTKNSATQITATVPTRVTSGKITLTTSSSSTQSSSSFTLVAPPTLSRFSPTKGAVGTSVTIIGSNFDAATSVTFNGASATFTVVSSTEITATVPAAATKGKINVTTSAGTDASSTVFTVLPGITGISPTSGTVGTSVTITGTGFSTTKSVKFNGVTATFTKSSDNAIVATVPSRAATGTISVTTGAGTVTSGANFSVLPNVTSFSPSSGAVGATVTITGTNFTGATSVDFNGVSASFSVRSSTSIRAIVPVGASTGFITVTTPDGSASGATDFTVTGSSSGLSLTSFSPVSGAVGSTVIIRGTGFSGITSVKFGGVSASYTVNSTTQITATVPATATSGQVSVSTASETASSASNFSVTPQMTSFSPSSGPVGTTVVITGSGLGGTNSVKFNGVSAGFTVNSATQVTATVPASASTGKIVLTTSTGTVTSSTNFTVVGAPTITSFTPTSGATGSTVSIFGSGFDSPAVTFNGVSASIVVVSSSQITATVPATATTGYINVTTANGSATSSSQFTVFPSITSFTPSSGLPGSAVTLTGTGFSGVTSVKFNGVSASFTLNSATQITATVPASATSGPISVATASGSASTATNFTVTTATVAPTISSFTPSSGSVGTSVTITGTEFTGATSVQFNGTSATSFTVVSSTQITAVVPTGASSGKISVTTAGGTATSSTNFTLVAGPSLTSFTPTNGTVGTIVTIIGTNLSGVTNVYFNGVSATFSIISSTQLTATVPSDASTGKITLVASSGSIISTNSFSVTPQLTTFTPTSGSAGTAITISGSGFIGTTAVKFNNVSATYTIVSANEISAVVPSGNVTGKITVTTASATATSSGTFTLTSPPTITSFTPTRGNVGSLVSIFGSNLTASSVQFNGTSTTFTQVSSSQINATVPSGATTGKITVVTSAGAFTSSTNYTVTPTIASFSPTSGPIGTTVVISGEGFSSVTTVRINGKNAAFTVDSPTQITATVPSGSSTGPVSVTTSAGTATGNNFTVTPTLSSFAPQTGVVGTSVTLTGSAFNNVSSVLLNGSPVTFSVLSSTSIRVNIPIGATSGIFTVTTNDGTASSSGSFTVIASLSITGFSPACSEIGTQVTVTGVSFIGVTEVLVDTSFCLFTVPSDSVLIFTVPVTATTGRIKIISSLGTAQSATDFVPVNVPDVISFSPTSGPVGTTVVLYGTGFCTALSVDFNGTFATFTVNSDEQITTTVPFGATTGGITVINTVGSFTTPTNFTVTPDIISFNPTSGYVGDNVIITGTNFTGATLLEFNGVASVFTVDSYSQITATVPVGATTGFIVITTPDGTDASPTVYSVLPKIDSFTPTTGIVGDMVTINGSGLNSATSVTFNGTSAGYTIISEAQIDAIVPFGATTGTISVTTPVGSATSSSQFNVEPHVTGFTPVNGVVGNNITIFGSAFTGTTDVQFGGVSATFTVNSYSQITATVPPNAVTGLITVTTTSGSDASPGTFTVLPNVTGFSPTSGVIGTSVNISGTTFTGTTDVSFNGTSAAFTVISDVLITATVPSGASTGLISVTNPDGTDYSSTSFTVLPDVASFTPTTGEVGDAVTINGTGFTGATAVQFNGVSASFTVNSDIDISATVPNLATTGVITVTTPSGTNSSTTNFNVEPTITTFTPTSGIPGTSVTISGYAFTGATAVAFNGTNASFTVNSYGQITATVPAGATTGTISVTTPSGLAISGTMFSLTPNITSFSPSNGVIGTVVTILGTNFTGATDVTFNGTSAVAYTVVSATQIDATVPSGATTGLIAVTTPSGTGTSASSFSVKPNITGFVPSTAEVGQSVVISGTSFTGATSVTFNGTTASFTVNTDAQITATVPNGSTTGVIVVTTPSGTGTSTSFGVEPTISSFSPSFGVVGTSVTITGTAFTGASAVTFNGVSASYTVNTYTQITATVPSGALTGVIAVTNSGGTNPSATNFSVRPTISGFSPSSGVIGSTVTLTGLSFTGTTAVLVNGVNAPSFTIVSPTQIDVTVPAGATTGLITVTNAGGSTNSSTSYTVLPNIISFTNSPGPVGTSVVITGTAFTGATSVTFGGVSASYTVNTSTQITATVPAGANTGAIAVTTAAGTATSATNFVVTPSVSGFTPSSGPVGTSVTINGQAFNGATSVTFNGSSASFTVNSNTQITATVPAAATTGTIAVTTPSGTGTSGSNFSVTPTITSFSPTSGVIGATVTINGTKFTGATAVTFNGVNAPSYTVISATQIDVTVPAGATTGLISVTTPSGSINSSSSFTVLPNIVSFTNSPGPVGTSVVITGTAFTGASSVTFNGVSASYTVNTSTQITATVPSGATTGAIAVTTSAGTATSATNFVVTPSISSFSPSSGAIGATVTINGQAFTGVTNVAFNGTNASFTFVSNTQVTATVPAGATTGTISLTTPSGTGTSAGSFTVNASIASFTPASGVVGTSVIITGTGFFSVTNVRFNGVNAASYTVDSPTQITAVVPTATTSGLVSVLTSANTANSATNFSIVPSISSLGTTSGPVGTSVTINGAGFGAATSVTFNGVSATFTPSSSPYTSITATVPSGATTGTVSVTTPGGTGTSAGNFTVTPSISSFSPSSGSVGATVTINGQAFTGVTNVSFNGTSASFTFVSNTQVTATVPSGATNGTITLTTPSGMGTSGSSFSVVPTISSLSMTSGVIGSSFTINGNSFNSVTDVRMNGVSVGGGNYTVVNSGQINVTVPSGATSGFVSVITSGGTGTSASSYSVLPNITGFSASSGVVGASITINGTGFFAGTVTSVKYNGVNAAYVVTPTTSISTTVPSGATTGFVTVVTSAGTAISATMFSVTPTISSFGPGSGFVGDSITITGEGFTGATNVSFNGTSAGFLVYSATSIKAAVPAGATDGFITVTTPSGSISSNPTSFDVLPKLAVLNELNAMLVVDAKGFEQRLFFGKVSEANVELANKFELGPVMKGRFDVRFAPQSNQSNGRLVELFSASQKNMKYRLQIEAAKYPLTIHFDKAQKQNSAIRISSLVDGNPVNTVELTKSKSFTIENEKASELLIEIGEEVELPTEFALKQNYPNPFNPSTAIQYALPGTYWVSLKVYNILGEEVADLVSQEKEQGAYTVQWNAVNLPTGVYTYRLTAFEPSNRSKQAFVEVKKMLLIK